MDESDEQNSAWLNCDFSSSAQGIATFPNLVFNLNQLTMQCLINAVGENCGIWGSQLPGFQPHEPGQWENEFPLMEHHWMWGKPEYQDWLIHAGWFGEISGFQMMIPVGVPVRVLRNVKKSFDASRWEMDVLPELLDQLPWAAVSLTWGEMGHAVFIGGTACRELVDNVINALIKTGEARAKIVVGQDGKATWRRL